MSYRFNLESEPFEFYPDANEYGFEESDLFELDPEILAAGSNRSNPDYIRWVQNSLNRILGIRLVADGIMGAQTKNAIQAFQKVRGLTPDGIVGPMTEQALAGAATPSGTAQPYAPARPVSYRFFKDSPGLQTISLEPAVPIAINQQWPAVRRKLAATYNRLGGLIKALANEVQIEVASVLSVWFVESGGRVHIPGKAIIRFENHLFYRQWGKNNEALYNTHFRHGGRSGHPGKPWQNHDFRETQAKQFEPVHTSQDTEYRALSAAANLGGEDAALKSISIGGPQILISNHSSIGYSTPRAMYDAFQNSERYHVLGFFDFCNQTGAPGKGDLIRYLRNQRWQDFARYYNGPGQVETYGGFIQKGYSEAVHLPIA